MVRSCNDAICFHAKNVTDQPLIWGLPIIESDKNI
ncbi:protein of unknown function [Denitratisoma oestradiolicum]|uniref:Uncharacterized protein n=1 Tax=Denitratisoma oestradiolicum TaxID=311182 RepID=A0A6S6XZC8_9PROT|nr:protein of unknown function [Denitratisoma oestradiolicum]